ncbi:MAG TPA: glycosyl hydrolase family 28 protein [Paludibacter sp.]
MHKLILSLGLLVISFTANSRDYVVTNFKVGTDSTKLSTKAIQKVIDKASQKGGGTIVIPKGVFLTGALFFKPNTSLRLQKGAVLKGSDNIADYPLIPSRMEGKKLDYYAALINAYKVDGFSITGPGTINGNGMRYWKYFWAYRDSMKLIGKSATNLEVHRPRLLFIWGCNNVKISDVSLCNSGFWTTHLYQCNDVLIENCNIHSPFAPVKAPSTDGVDIDVCKRVTIRKCTISVNDDAVCIKGGKGPNAHNLPENGIVEDVLVEDCTFGESHGVLTLGSESIHARNIMLRNCTVESNTPLLRLKMRPDTYQIFENITIDNITGKCGSIIDMNPWTQFYTMEGSNEKPYGIVRNISISNINMKCNRFGIMKGNPADTVSNVLFKNINVNATATGFKTSYKDIKTENVTVNGSPLVIE